MKIIAALILMVVPVGQPAPVFERPDINGKTVDIQSYRGRKNVLLVFSRYIGCSWCQMFIVDLLKHADGFAAARTEIIIVTNSDEETARKYRPPRDFPFLLVPDPDMELYRLYGVKMKGKSLTWNVLKRSIVFLKYLPQYDWVERGLEGDHYQTPACFIIDSSGRVRYSFVGKDVADNPDVDELLKLLKESRF